VAKSLNERIRATFLEEGNEQLEALGALLLELEAHPGDAESIAALLRIAHNFKGAAGTAGFPTLANVAHATEEVLERLRDAKIAAVGGVFDRLFATVDELKAQLGRLADGHEPDELGALVNELKNLGLGSVVLTPVAPHGGDVVLGEYDLVRIKVLRKRGFRILRLTLSPPHTDAKVWKWARQVAQKLRTEGDVIGTEPRETEFKAGLKFDLLVVVLATVHADAELRALLSPLGADNFELVDLYAKTAEASPDYLKRPTTVRQSLKVDVERVDNLVDMIGELVVVQSMVANAPEFGAAASRRISNCLSQLTRITRELQDAGLRLRMVPLVGVFQHLSRMVRDLSHKTTKEVVFTTSGENVEMDRGMVEHVVDPLVHMLRNAIDHGIEAPEERQRCGKPSAGRISLSAYHQGGSIVLDVVDDGRGLDRAKILAKARERGLLREEVTPSDAELLNLVFESGFSTATEVTEISGRGVGMDVVRKHVEEMRGRVAITSTPGVGTTIKIVLPLTLAIIDGMLIGCGSERYILPTIAIVESLRPAPAALSSVAGRHQMLSLRGHLLPLVSLAELFHVNDGCNDPCRGLVVVVESVGRRVGLVVDDVLAQQQVVIKNLGQGLGRAPFLSGAAILPDGRVGLILNVDEVAAFSTSMSTRSVGGRRTELASPQGEVAAGAPASTSP